MKGLPFGWEKTMAGFLIYFLLILIIPLWAQMKVRNTYRKYSQIANSTGMTGAETARKILDANGLNHVRVEQSRGMLSDHYDPRQKVVRLSRDNYHGRSLAGTAVAAHEVGHAIQDARNYAPLRFRHALVPVASIGSNAAFFFILIGLLLQATGMFLLGIVFFAAAVLFQLVTLPVEFNASDRAMEQVVSLGIIENREKNEAKKVLNAAAMTYVASALVALLELLRFILLFVGMNQEE